MEEVVALLFRHFGIHEGMHQLEVEFQLTAGAVGPDKLKPLPGVAFGISKIGIRPTKSAGGLTYDAAQLNPAKKTTARRRTGA